MVFAAFLAVLVLAAVEIFVIVAIAHVIGWALTVALLIVSTVAGLWLVRVQGRRAWGALRGAVASGVVPDRELGDAALILAGGALIAVPGLVTDVIGMLAVAPFTRPLVRRIFGLILFRRAAAVGVRVGSRLTRARSTPAGPSPRGPSGPDSSGAPRSAGAAPQNAKIIRGEVVDGGAAAPNGRTGAA
jgi:UPF0716 family protein affecting phage T7 exclusion